MHSDAMPLIKIEVEHMKHAIISHIGLAGSELGEYVQKRVDRLIKDYPWDEQIKEIVNQALYDQINSYFKYGEGSKKIREAVDEGFKGFVEQRKGK